METTSLNLVKGQKVDLTKTHPGLKKAHVGLGWDVNATGTHQFDLDAFAFLLVGGKIPDNSHIIFFRNLEGHGVKHSGDNLTGQGDGDDETIYINLEQIPQNVDEIVLGVNIYEAKNRGNQNFGQVNNSFIRIYDGESNQEMMKFDLNEDHSTGSGMIMGKLYRKDAEWKFQAVGQSVDGDLNQIAAPFRPQSN
jgi:tellurium resistance protein TerD